MRYRPEHKAEVHQKIVKDASRRVRAEGLNGAAVASVMRDTGLTHGGFYKHFGNKDELLLESLREAFREMTGTLVHAAEQSPPETAWKAIVKTYLSLEYCDHAERGCPLAALAPELARVDKGMRGTGPCRAGEVQGSNASLYAGPARRRQGARILFDIFNHDRGGRNSLACCQSPRCGKKCWRAQESFSCTAFEL